MNRSEAALAAVVTRLNSMEFAPKPVSSEEPARFSSPRSWVEWASDAEAVDLEWTHGPDGQVYIIYAYCLLTANSSLRGRPSAKSSVGATEKQAGNLMHEFPWTFNSHEDHWVMKLSNAEIDRRFAPLSADLDADALGIAVVARIEARYRS